MIKHVEIENIKGYILRGYLHLPENANKIVIMYHGFTGNKTEHNGHFRNLSRLLYNKGVASIRMDYHGNGESDGEFSDFTFLDALDDAKKVLEYAHNIEGIQKVAILGFSFGGALASLIANDDNCDQLLLISAAANMPILTQDKYNTWRKLDNGNYYASGFELSQHFGDGLIGRNMYENTINFSKNVLIIQARQDLAVPYMYGVKYAVNYKNSRLHLVPNAGHGYDSLENMEELYNECIKFLTL